MWGENRMVVGALCRYVESAVCFPLLFYVLKMKDLADLPGRYVVFLRVDTLFRFSILNEKTGSGSSVEKRRTLVLYIKLGEKECLHLYYIKRCNLPSGTQEKRREVSSATFHVPLMCEFNAMSVR